MSIDDVLIELNSATATRTMDTIGLGIIKSHAAEERRIVELADSGQVDKALEKLNILIETIESHTRTLTESCYYLSHVLTLCYLRKMLVLKKKRKTVHMDKQNYTALLADYLSALDNIISLKHFLPILDEDQRNWTAKVLDGSRKARTELLAEIEKREITLPS